MAASDHLGPQWYHGTPAELREGDTVAPGRERANDQSKPGASTHVFFSSDPSWARDMAANAARNRGASDAYVYHVQPSGDYHRDIFDHLSSYKSQAPLTVVRPVAHRSMEVGERWHDL